MEPVFDNRRVRLYTVMCILVAVVIVSKSSDTYGQRLNTTAITAAGATLSDGLNHFAYSFGEPVVGLISSDGWILLQGFTQYLSWNVTSVEEISGETGLIYPNPATEKFFGATSLRGTNVSIEDFTGKRLSYGILTEEGVELNDLASGMYLVRFLDKAGRILFQQKLIVR